MMSPSPEVGAITKRIVAPTRSGQEETGANFRASQNPLLFRGSAMIEIRQRQTLRDTGDVNQTKDDSIGKVINKSVRIAATAPPGMSAVSDLCRATTGHTDEFVFSNRSTVSLLAQRAHTS